MPGTSGRSDKDLAASQDSVRTRDLPAYKLRMPQDLRQQLEKEASISGRTLHTEIIARLKASLAPTRRRASYALTEPPSPEYIAHGDTERALLAVLKRLGPEKQLALLSLFK